MRWRDDLLRRWRNLFAGTGDGFGTVDLWVDDERAAPEGWYHAVTAEEAIDVLCSRVVRQMSLDHDLGGVWTGYDLLLWLGWDYKANGLNHWPALRPRIHSANPVGRQNMTAAIENDGPTYYGRDHY